MMLEAHSIGRDLKAIFEKCDAPACEDDHPQRFRCVFQVPIPSEGHERIRNDEQKNGDRGSHAISVNEILSAYECIHIMLLEGRQNRITTLDEFCYRDSINFRHTAVGTPQNESVFAKT
jgi:hypothetical protein